MREIRLQTMPLKFRVWDKEKNKLREDLSFWQVAHLLNQDAWGEQKVNKDDRFVVSQATGLVSDEGYDIYTGDIIKVSKEPFPTQIMCVWYDMEYAVCLGYGRGNHYIELPNMDVKDSEITKLGTIWENPELLEENMGDKEYEDKILECEYLYNIGAISLEEKARRRYHAKLLQHTSDS